MIDSCGYFRESTDWFGFPNSWGTSWGAGGRGRFTSKGFGVLLNTPGAVVATAVEDRKTKEEA